MGLLHVEKTSFAEPAPVVTIVDGVVVPPVVVPPVTVIPDPPAPPKGVFAAGIAQYFNHAAIIVTYTLSAALTVPVTFSFTILGINTVTQKEDGFPRTMTIPAGQTVITTTYNVGSTAGYTTYGLAAATAAPNPAGGSAITFGNSVLAV
jgi:hypothetical protein